MFENVTVFPIIGNHEAYPANLFPPHYLSGTGPLSQDALYYKMRSVWSYWIPLANLNTVLEGGYYTVLVKPGFRIIVLNSNVCFEANLWLLYDDKLWVKQFQWLHDILLLAELNGEKVHILSHLPIKDVMYHKCSYNLNLIIQR